MHSNNEKIIIEQEYNASEIRKSFRRIKNIILNTSVMEFLTKKKVSQEILALKNLEKICTTDFTYLGLLIGINGVITFKNCNLKDTLKKLNPEDIVLETDSPYMTPHPYRGQRNESKNIVLIANFICEIFNISSQKLAEITNKNVHSIFDI